MTVAHCSCHVGGGGDLSPKSVQGTALGNSEDLNFKIPKRGQKNIVAIHFRCVIGRKSKENLPKFTRWLRKTNEILRKVTNY